MPIANFSISAYYKSISLEGVNARRKNLGLPELPKLGGLTYQDKLKNGMISDRHTRWEHDGYRYTYYEYGGKTNL